MAGFLVEFRIHGYAKEYAKDIVYSVSKNCSGQVKMDTLLRVNS
jgi:hypothetical protein